MTTIVHITLIQKDGTIKVRSDAIGSDEEVLSVSLQMLSHLMMLESAFPGQIEVMMPTLSQNIQ